MPFKSEAQRRKFYALKAEGKMDQKTIDEWEAETPENIPERVPKSFKKGFKKKAALFDLKGALVRPQKFDWSDRLKKVRQGQTRTIPSRS